MSRYRKIDVRMWGDEKFRSLSKCSDGCAQFLWFYLLTNEDTTCIPGVYRASRGSIIDILGWTRKGFDKAFRELFEKGMVKADWEARVVWIPNFMKYNGPESPNVVAGWRKWVDEIPECRLRDEAFAAISGSLEGYSKGFQEALPETFEKVCPNQEQEQEQEEEECCERSQATDSQPPSPVVCSIPLIGKKEFPVTEALIEELSPAYPCVDFVLQAHKARQWCLANPKKMKRNGRSFFLRWLAKAQEDGPSSARQPRREDPEVHYPDFTGIHEKKMREEQGVQEATNGPAT